MARKRHEQREEMIGGLGRYESGLRKEFVRKHPDFKKTVMDDIDECEKVKERWAQYEAKLREEIQRRCPRLKMQLFETIDQLPLSSGRRRGLSSIDAVGDESIRIHNGLPALIGDAEAAHFVLDKLFAALMRTVEHLHESEVATKEQEIQRLADNFKEAVAMVCQYQIRTTRKAATVTPSRDDVRQRARLLLGPDNRSFQPRRKNIG